MASGRRSRALPFKVPPTSKPVTKPSRIVQLNGELTPFYSASLEDQASDLPADEWSTNSGQKGASKFCDASRMWGTSVSCPFSEEFVICGWVFVFRKTNAAQCSMLNATGIWCHCDSMPMWLNHIDSMPMWFKQKGIGWVPILAFVFLVNRIFTVSQCQVLVIEGWKVAIFLAVLVVVIWTCGGSLGWDVRVCWSSQSFLQSFEEAFKWWWGWWSQCLCSSKQ